MHQEKFSFRSPNVGQDGGGYYGGAYFVISDGAFGVDWYIGNSYGRSSPSLGDVDYALYVFPDGDVFSDYSRNISDSYGNIFNIL